MVNLVNLGSVALDTVKTPFGEVKETIGGSGVYFSLGASFFTKPGLISVVGRDFPKTCLNLLEKKGVCLKGVRFSEKKTLRWHAYYEYDMNEAHTVKLEAEIFEDFGLDIPEDYRDAKYVFLGNIDPEIQIEMLERMKNPKFSVLDSMNYWIEKKRSKVLKAIGMVDMLLLNEAEIRELFKTPNFVSAAKKALSKGPKFVLVKKGEHGAVLFSDGVYFFTPGYPLETVKDPTGAGDSFAGGFLGWVAKTDNISEANLRKAVVYGSVIASYNAEDFSINKLKKLNETDIKRRYQEFKKLVYF